MARIADYKYNDERNDSKLGDMTYEEWKHAKDKPGTEPVKEELKVEKGPLVLDSLKRSMKESDYNDFYAKVDNAENRKLYEKYSENGTYVNKPNAGRYKKGSDTVEYSYNKGKFEGIDKYSTLAHESNHLFDSKIGRNENLHYNEIDTINQYTRGMIRINTIEAVASSSDEFLSALREDMENMKPLLSEKAEGTYQYKAGEMHNYFRGKSRLGELMFETEEMFNASGGIQDAIDGFYGGKGTKVGWGHGDRYYNREYNGRIVGLGKEKGMKDALNELGFDASNQTKVKMISRQYEAASEAWANVGSAVTTQGKELEMMEKYMPKTVEAYKHIVEVI